MDIIPILVGAFTGLVTFCVALGTWKSWPKRRFTPKVTVMVCARDEEKILFDCLMSLETQDYPDDRYKLVLIDHLSTDRTGEIMDTFAEASAVETEVIHVREPHPELKGKIHALYEGMKQVDTEFVLMTDGDCVVPESWIRTITGYFTDDVIAVSGMATIGFEEATGRKLLTRAQNVDHLYYYGSVGGLSGIAWVIHEWLRKHNLKRKIKSSLLQPTFVGGNNLAFRLSAYNAIGGYEAIGPTMIEDYELLTRMVRKTGGHLAFGLEPEAAISTRAMPDLKSLWHQKRRWATATHTMHEISYFLYGVIFLSRIVLPWMLLWQPTGAFIGLLLNGFATSVLVHHVGRLMGEHIRIRDVIMVELYEILLNHASLLATLTRRPVFWKGERYPRGGKRTRR